MVHRLLKPLAFAGLALFAAGGADMDENPDQTLLERARIAVQQGRLDEGVKLATRAIEAAPKLAPAYILRGRIYASRRESKQAAAEFSQALKWRPASADLYDLRGSEYFKLAEIDKSLSDFDKAVKLDPRRERGHWKRGITLYYAGKFDDGRRQFEAYQTFDDNDVENAVWRYLCMARAVGVKKARSDILNIKDDRRVPMMQVYALYAGKMSPDDVLGAVRAGNPTETQLNQRLFYAHLYLGLYYDAGGDKKRALEHIEKADSHKIGHYMWDVAHVHRQLLRKSLKPPGR